MADDNDDDIMSLVKERDNLFRQEFLSLTSEQLAQYQPGCFCASLDTETGVVNFYEIVTPTTFTPPEHRRLVRAFSENNKKGEETTVYVTQMTPIDKDVFERYRSKEWKV